MLWLSWIHDVFDFGGVLVLVPGGQLRDLNARVADRTFFYDSAAFSQIGQISWFELR